MPLTLVPMTLRDAHAFVEQHHRHHAPSVGGLFAVGVAEGDAVVGVAVVGRPIARRNDDGYTAEVTRVATDGARNACSMLYGACWRAARALGYHRLITYTLKTESGASLRGAGWRVVGEVKGQSWSVPSRPRVDRYPLQDKLKWEMSA
jgi:hypothetical protein